MELILWGFQNGMTLEKRTSGSKVTKFWKYPLKKTRLKSPTTNFWSDILAKKSHSNLTQNLEFSFSMAYQAHNQFLPPSESRPHACVTRRIFWIARFGRFWRQSVGFPCLIFFKKKKENSYCTLVYTSYYCNKRLFIIYYFLIFSYRYFENLFS